MSIPIIAGPIGYDSWYVKVFRNMCDIVGDPKKFVMDWITPEKKLVVHTDRLDDTTFYRITSMLEQFVPANIELVQYNHNMEISWRDINKYAACTNIADMIAVNPDFKNDLTSDGEWIWPLPKMVNFSQRYPRGWAEDAGLAQSKARIVDIELPNDEKLDSTFRGMSQLEHIKLSAPSARMSDHAWVFSTKIKTFELNAPKITKIHCMGGQTDVEYIKLYAPLATYVEFRRCPRLTTFEGELPSLSDIDPNWGGFATEARLNKESALRILNSIPAYTSGTHRIQLGIHVDHQDDPEILSAITDAEAKGWTLTVKWNPGGPTYTTPTA